MLGYSLAHGKAFQNQRMNNSVLGYAEGYYGQLLTWSERALILESLQAHGQNTYYYAPKEDALHRLQWREPYPIEWREKFAQFCTAAKSRGIRIVAGVAPGLDFDFNHISGGSDLQAVLDKCRQLKQDGADHLSLLMDDIDADFASRRGDFNSEGEAHARLANIISDELGEVIWVTPRIYANELAAEEPDYLPDFFATLYSAHTVLYCGTDVVAHQLDPSHINAVAQTGGQRIVMWDNVYANDYCPRRLYVGPWQGREAACDVLLNPTGRVHTDCLLLELMSGNGLTRNDHNAVESRWCDVLEKHGVPKSFMHLAPYFHHPVFNNQLYSELQPATEETFFALEECLWRWKTPLSREWYGFIFGLKHDLLMENNTLPTLRIQKTQNFPLASLLMNRDQ